ncbi:hypothetical protein LJ739_18290 [Aestuariibacter halophilus]|uniref:Adhesin domain-containing protein n=1 Tax=Fluctibacter halophilus TaxID=226011 RepID=A0ABS8GCB5_9ALTE|nr:hypothetical protein [Aestuariibacter halophilus]MCC2618212.1 hypothetical protein [Aestuariibacter halophilus]
MKTLPIALSALLLAQGAAHADETRNLELNSADINELYIDAGRGELRVKGVDGLEDIQVDVKLGGREFDELEPGDIELSLTQRGDKALLVAKFHRRMGNADVYMDVDVKLPSRLMLEVDDGAGNTVISDIKNTVRVDDGSGDLEIHTITGALYVDDGSGDLKITTVTGNVNIDDGSGALALYTVTGNVEIDDGSGNIEVRTVTGDVEVEDGSGNIELVTINGDVVVDDGSGNIDVDDAQSFHLIDDGSGRVQLRNIRDRK